MRKFFEGLFIFLCRTFCHFSLMTRTGSNSENSKTSGASTSSGSGTGSGSGSGTNGGANYASGTTNASDTNATATATKQETTSGGGNGTAGTNKYGCRMFEGQPFTGRTQYMQQQQQWNAYRQQWNPPPQQFHYQYWQPQPQYQQPQPYYRQFQPQIQPQFSAPPTQPAAAQTEGTTMQQVPIPFGEKQNFPHGKDTDPGAPAPEVDWREFGNLMRYKLNEFADDIQNLKDMKMAAMLLDQYYAKDINDVVQYTRTLVEHANRMVGMLVYTQTQNKELKRQVEMLRHESSTLRDVTNKCQCLLVRQKREHDDEMKKVNAKLAELNASNKKLLERTQKQFIPWQIKVKAAVESLKESTAVLEDIAEKAPDNPQYAKRTRTPTHTVNLAETDEE